jgi:cell division septal protein FtsQ
MHSKSEKRRLSQRLTRHVVNVAASVTASVVAIVWAQTAWALSPFIIKDIRIEGIQRTEPCLAICRSRLAIR